MVICTLNSTENIDLTTVRHLLAFWCSFVSFKIQFVQHDILALYAAKSEIYDVNWYLAVGMASLSIYNKSLCIVVMFLV